MKVLNKIGDVIDRICGALTVIMVAAMVIITSAQIICRVLSGSVAWIRPLSWSEEATRFLLVWASFVGATCAYRHGSNIAITAVQGLFPAKVQRVLKAFVHLVCMVLFSALMVYGIQYCGKQVRNAAAIPIKMKYVYSIIPCSMGVLIYHALTMMLNELTTKDASKEAK